MDELSKLFASMEVQETRLLGIAHCIVPKEEEHPFIEPIFVPSSVSLTSAINKQTDSLPEQTKGDIEPINSDINVINEPSDVPSLILSSLTNSLSATITESTIKDVIPTTTEIQPLNPDENNIAIVTHMANSNESIKTNVLPMVSATIPLNGNDVTAPSSLNNKLENMTVLEVTPSTNVKSLPQTTETLPTSSPSIAEIVLGEMESVSQSPESDNYIYETFSPVNFDTASSLQRNEHIILPEKPPEIPMI